MGSGTTGAVAKLLHRKWIGIERDEKYIELAEKRISATIPTLFDDKTFEVRSQKKLMPRVDFSVLVENNYLQPGQTLYFRKNPKLTATIKPDSRLRTADGFEGSIHAAGGHFMNGSPCNGWDHWYIDDNSQMSSLDTIRQKYLTDNGLIE
jgi:modification methylase